MSCNILIHKGPVQNFVIYSLFKYSNKDGQKVGELDIVDNTKFNVISF